MRYLSITPKGGKAFDKHVEKKGAFVKFYHPQCGHCQNMAADWKGLEEELKRISRRHMNVIEVHADAIPQIKSSCAQGVRGYPTIMQVNPGGHMGREFTGERNFDSLRKFMLESFDPMRKTKTLVRRKRKKKRTKGRRATRRRPRRRTKSSH